MLSRLIAFSLAQRLLIIVASILMIAAGYQAFKGLPIDAFPDVSTTQVKLIMKAPGMTPEEIEARIVAPIEQELLGIPKQAILRSQSKYAIADITLDFQDGTDVFWARQQVSERLSNVMKDLPASVSGGLAPITTPLGEIFMFTIEGSLSLMEKRSLLEWTIRPQLRNIAGVADVNSLGGMVKSFEIVPDTDALIARGISLAQLQRHWKRIIVTTARVACLLVKNPCWCAVMATSAHSTMCGRLPSRKEMVYRSKSAMWQSQNRSADPLWHRHERW
jgi:cobalt-zinc-cadmium resistance protein CzcA